MTEQQQLEKIKAALGIADEYHNDTLMIYLQEVRYYLESAGVDKEIVNSSKVIGVLCRGVADLWSYGSGTGKLSNYFYERVIQLCYEIRKGLEEDTMTDEEIREELRKIVMEYLKDSNLKGDPGDSAYKIAVTNGFVGSEQEWIASLRGENGEKGEDGQPGEAGASAYEIAVANGFVGNIMEWLASLKGEKGEDGVATDILKDKKLLCIGDSICEGVGANGKPYPYWLKQWHPDATVYNLGVGGMTIAQKDSSITNSMPVRIANGEFAKEEYADPDIIIFEGGINDFMNNVKHGYITKSYNPTKYITFCQGMEFMFNYFKNLFPKARMIFCSTHNLKGYDYNKAQSWWCAAAEICTKWGVEFLDLFALICTEKVNGLQLHPDENVHKEYYAKLINNALINTVPLAGAKTTTYYNMNPACTIYLHSGTKEFAKGTEISTSDWRVNMIRCDATTYENVTGKVTYDLSEVDNTTVGNYPVHIGFTENGVNLSLDVDVTITGSGSETVEKVLQSITAKKTKTTYTVGEEVSKTDITVTASYNDSSTADVTSVASIDTSNVNPESAGEYNIAISYTEKGVTKTTTVQIKIVESGSGGEVNTVASGKARDNNNTESVTWELDSTGVLKLDAANSNTTIATYNAGTQPWADYLTQITKAVFAKNIVNTGGNILQNATALKEVEFAGESIAIAVGAFKGCTALATIDLTKVNYIAMNGLANCGALPKEIVLGATSLATQAFYYQSQITTIRFNGKPDAIAADALKQVTAWNSAKNLKDIYVPWEENAVDNSPWGATDATIHYNQT